MTRPAKILWTAAAIVYLALLCRPVELLLARPFLDEAFHTLSAARALDAPAFWLAQGNMALALRLCLLWQVVLFGLASLAIGAGLWYADRERSPSTPWLIAALVFANYTFSVAFLDGMGTGFVTAVVFAAFVGYRRWMTGGSFRAAGRSLVLLLLLAAVAWASWRPGYLPPPGSLTTSNLHPVQFDDVRPMSTWIATIRVLSNQCFGIVHLPTRHDHFGTSNIAGLALLVTTVALVLAVPRLRWHAREAFIAWRRRWNLGVLAPLWLYSTLLLVAYTLFHRVPHLQAHHLVIPRVLMLFVLASFGVAFLQTFAARRLLLLLAFAGWGLVSLGLQSRNFSGIGGNVMLGPAEWIRLHVPPGERVAMFQSGTTGFLHPDKVVGLDGNLDHEALVAVRTGRLSAFLTKRNVHYLVDRPEYLAFARQDTAVARRSTPLAILENELEVWVLKPE